MLLIVQQSKEHYRIWVLHRTKIVNLKKTLKLFFSFDIQLYDVYRCFIFVFILFLNLCNGGLCEYAINQYLTVLLVYLSVKHFYCVLFPISLLHSKCNLCVFIQILSNFLFLCPVSFNWQMPILSCN
jgi:hypothetical protein